MGEALSAPEKKHTLDGNPVASFNLAINTATDDNAEAKPASIKITAGKKLADKSVLEINTGDMLVVEGKLYTKTIENRLGQKQKIPYIQATNIKVLKDTKTTQLPDPVQVSVLPPLKTEDDEEIPF